MKPQGFPPDLRLRTQADFDRVFAAKVRAADGRILLFAVRNGTPHTRLGLVVSRKQGNSVKRHRLKRRLREAFRLVRPELPTGLDLVAIPQGAESSSGDYQASLQRLVRKLSARLDQPPQHVQP